MCDQENLSYMIKKSYEKIKKATWKGRWKIRTKKSYRMIKKDPLGMEGENVGQNKTLIYDEKTHMKWWKKATWKGRRKIGTKKKLI